MQDVVLIVALRAEPFWRQNADNGERHVLDAQDLTDGIVVAKDLRRGGLADDADLVGAAHVLLGEMARHSPGAIAGCRNSRPIRRARG